MKLKDVLHNSSELFVDIRDARTNKTIIKTTQMKAIKMYNDKYEVVNSFRSPFLSCMTVAKVVQKLR